MFVDNLRLSQLRFDEERVVCPVFARFFESLRKSGRILRDFENKSEVVAGFSEYVRGLHRA